MRGAWLFIAVILLGVGGCSAAPSLQSNSSHLQDFWIARHGGLGDPSRVARISDRFSPIIGKPIHINILKSDDLAAWSWPDGHIYVTRGLERRLDDNELAAVIGHELGHVLSRSHSENTAAFLGKCAGGDVEQAADQVGVHLLEAAHLPPTAARSALRKLLASTDLNPQCRAAIEARIARLP